MIITVVRKPLIKSVCVNIQEYNCGGINIDKSRIGKGTGEVVTAKRPNMKGGNYGQGKDSYGKKEVFIYQSVDIGKWPANFLVKEGSHNLFPYTKSGTLNSHVQGGDYTCYGKMYARHCFSKGSEGSAIRFFKKIKE